jgi:hypothetical protein
MVAEMSFFDFLFFAGPFLLGLFILLAAWYRLRHGSE